MKKRRYHYLLILGLFLFETTICFGYDFSQVRKSLSRDLASKKISNGPARLAIVYKIQNRESIKRQFNLIQLKKELSLELLKSFEITDPVLVNEILKTNQLEYQQLVDNKSILRQFADRADCTQVLLVDLQMQGNHLKANFKMVSRDNRQISFVQVSIPPESKKPAGTKPTEIVSRESKPQKTVFQSFDLDFVPQSFPTDHNDNWIFFAPTALLNPEIQSLELTLWLKHLGEVDIRPIRFRYNVRMLEVLQFGIQSYAISEKVSAKSDKANLSKEQGLHSTYFSLKYQVVDESRLPVNIALGLRRRIHWDGDNTDFRTRDNVENAANQKKIEAAKDIDEKNDSYNQITIYAAVTGKLEAIGLLYNVYLDNQTIASGAKFLLTSDIKLWADAIFNYYENPQISSDAAFGIQIYSNIGSTTLSYQLETEQLQLGLLFDF